jgi:sec-independent protein translocase protein TatA
VPGWISPWELLILVFVILLVFGPKRLPQMGRSLGSGIRELKDSVKGHVDKQDAEAAAEQKTAAELPPAPPPREHDTVV